MRVSRSVRGHEASLSLFANSHAVKLMSRTMRLRFAVRLFSRSAALMRRSASSGALSAFAFQ